MSQAGTTTGSQRPVALAVIIAAGLLSLPVVAAFLDGDSTDQLIVPVQVVASAAVGALVGYVLPGLGGAGSSRPRSARVGAVVGLVTALVSVTLFYLALDGS